VTSFFKQTNKKNEVTSFFKQTDKKNEAHKTATITPASLAT
jgi:hypothetical protein